MGALDDLAASVRALPGGDVTPSARNLSALVTARVRDRGHDPYLTFYDESTGERTELSFATFDNWASKTANLLVEELALGRGDRVATVLDDHWTSVVVAVACWKVGCCVMPVAAGAGVGVREVLEASAAAAVFVREDLLDALTTPGGDGPQAVVVGTGLGARLGAGVDVPADALAYAEEVLAFADDYDDPGVGLDDDALLVLPPASGAAPAGVRLTQGNLLAAAEALGQWGLPEGGRILCAQSLQRVDGLVLAHLGALAAGGSVVLTRGLDPRHVWRRVTDERVSLLLAPPSFIDRLPAQPPPAVLRGALMADGAAPHVLASAAAGIPLAVGHGLVEATCASTLSPLDMDGDTRAWVDAAPGRPVGAVTARAAVAALGDDGDPLPPEIPGRLGVRGPVVMAGYDQRPDLDEQAFACGWYATADQGFTATGPDGRSHVFVTGPAQPDQAPGSGR